jgi:amidase
LNIWQQSATDLARQLRERTISAREVVAACLARIDAINPRVNAIVTLVAERAMEHARRADERIARGDVVGPLHGLPIAHKDLQMTAGIRTTFGSPIFRDYVPEEDSPLVARLKHAGAITVGKTNTPEFGAGSQTFNPVFGATLNPYDLTKTCGGSSGGAAVALACGMLPIADGTDMGGSLRNPAAFCGVVGMRPSTAFGLVPGNELATSVRGTNFTRSVPGTAAIGATPGGGTVGTNGVLAGSSWRLLSVDGPLARNAADVALLLSAIAGTECPALERDFQGCRIAWSMSFGDLPFDPRVLAVVDSQRRVFQSLGCSADNADADFSGADEAFKTLRAQAFINKHGDFLSQHRTQVKETILQEIERGERQSPDDIARAEHLRDDLRFRLAQFLTEYEFLILPTTQVPPFDVNQPFVTEVSGVPMTTYVDWMKSCYYISVTGHPAVSVPAGLTPDGLPVGLQIVGRDGDDWNVLRLAHAFERARGPFPLPSIALESPG